MIRKPFRLMFCILFTITITAACATPTPTQPLATETSMPSPISATSTPMTWNAAPTPIPGYVASPDWLPAGIISFSMVKEPNTVLTVGKSILYVVNTDGTGLVQLADGPNPWNDASSWSPDGKRIIFGTGSWNFSGYSIWAVNADGSEINAITHFPPSADFPSMSSDNSKIAFAITTNDMDSKIGVMNADGSDQQALTSGGPVDVLPTWTPDGLIVFLRITGDLRHMPADVFSIKPDGTNLIQLTNTGDVGGYALSPDGTKIAIYNIKDKRIKVVPVTANEPAMTLVDSDLGCSYIAMSWSPDGQAVAIACSDLALTNGSPLYIFKADGTSYTTVPGIEGAYDPAWRP